MQESGEEKKSRAIARHYTEEFKRSVIEEWVTSGKSGTVVAKEFGVQVWNLRDWKQRYFPAKGAGDPVAESAEGMRREIQALRQQLARVTNQREILKKTLGIISET